MIQDIMIMQKYVNNIVIADVRMPEEIDEIRDNFDNILDYVDCFKIYNVN